MKKNIKIIIVLILSIFLFTGCDIEKDNDGLTIVSTIFPAYDFTRAIIGEDSSITNIMLLSPGSEAHTYEPTPKDIINIKNSDIFIYVGGESDEWVDGILKDLDLNKTKVIKMIDVVDLSLEEIVEGMETKEKEEDTEYDEHVWTSPKNAIKILDTIYESIIAVDPLNNDKYQKNKDNYVEKLITLDNEFKELVENGKRKELIFGDRFPLRYFVDEYGLDYYAAFPGCSEQTEASAKTIAFLINKVKEDNIPVILKIELSNGKIAKAISEEAGVKVLTFNTAHNITKKDFDKGLTYIDLMNKNKEILKVALN